MKFCPECNIGLSNAEVLVGHCRNCHANFTMVNDEPELNEVETIHDAIDARVRFCKACSNKKFGVKTRLRVPHTCGKYK